MKLLFAGSPGIALPSLDLLHSHGLVAAVLTSPDAPVGRKRVATPSPVKARALALGLPVFTPEQLGRDARQEISAVGAELLAVVAYGKIFGPRFLALFPWGGINLHPSLLPKHRGPSPIPAAILAGDSYWGISVQQIAIEMDAGDILLQESYPLDRTATTGTLTAIAAERGAAAMLRVVEEMAADSLNPVPQQHDEASYCGLIRKEDGRIDWTLPADEIERLVRAYNPWPGAQTEFQQKKLTVWEAVPLSNRAVGAEAGKITAVDRDEGILVQTGTGILALRTLQLQGKKRLPWHSFANGVRGITGSTLGGHQ